MMSVDDEQMDLDYFVDLANSEIEFVEECVECD